MFASKFSVSEKYGRDHNQSDFLDLKQNEATSDRHECDNDYITRSAVWFYCKLKRSQAENIRIREKIVGKIVYTTKLTGFKVPTLNSGFKISGNTTKPGSFYIGFVHLCVNGETNQIVKCSGFVTNSQQFSLV